MTDTAYAIDEIRSQLKAVSEHLLKPNASGVRASLPHLERAVAVFSSYLNMKDLPPLEPAIEALRAELTLANMLFENAYMLQAGCATQLGLNLDGTRQQILYGRLGHRAEKPAGAVAHESWEG